VALQLPLKPDDTDTRNATLGRDLVAGQRSAAHQEIPIIVQHLDLDLESHLVAGGLVAIVG